MKETLLLVDGSSYLYRAYHAMPNFRNAKGEPMGALYGVVSMLRKLLADHKAHYAACIFDARGSTFRDNLYAEYKSHRPSMPEDLAVQIGPIYRVVRALGWPVLCVEGVEADDVIGTLAHQAREQNIHTIVSTGDKDLTQLVNSHVTLVNTMTAERLDQPGVLAKFNVPPDRIVDYLMLIGDTVDNIPGVQKVGPKTAVKWLNEHGSIEALVAAADSIKGIAGVNLRTAITKFALTRQLLTIKRDCDLAGHVDNLADLALRPSDDSVLTKIYENYGFRAWMQELTGDSKHILPQNAQAAGHAISLAPKTTDCIILTDFAEFDAWVVSLTGATLVAIDAKATSLSPMQARLVGISLAIEPGRACYIPLAHRCPGIVEQLPKKEVLARLKPWLENASAPKLLYHAKYNTHVFANEGITLLGVTEDIMLEAYVLESHSSVNLAHLAWRYLGRKGIAYESLCGKGVAQIDFDEVDIQQAGYYACESTNLILHLHYTLRPQVAQSKEINHIYHIELEVSEVLVHVERNGVRIDAPTLVTQSQSLGYEMLSLEKHAYELAGQSFNLNSPKQLCEILFTKMGLPVTRKTAGGMPSTNEDALTKLAEYYPLPKVLLEYRGLYKLKSMYTDKLPRMINTRTSRVHTHYSQTAVITGRLASSNPNLQNIPIRTVTGRRVREAFLSESGVIISADYSQIELRIMAHVADDVNLQGAFVAGKDIHCATASEIFSVPVEMVTFDQRRAAKTINFGLIYGMSVFGLAANLGITRDAAQNYIDRYFIRYTGVADYMANIKAKACQQGYVETVLGRKLWLPEINGGSGVRRAAAARAAINAPMQGTAADLIKLAMVAVQRWMMHEKLQSMLIMQVHDELVLEVPSNELDMVFEMLPRIMCGVMQLRVPLVAKVGMGKNWEKAH